MYDSCGKSAGFTADDALQNYRDIRYRHCRAQQRLLLYRTGHLRLLPRLRPGQDEDYIEI